MKKYIYLFILIFLILAGSFLTILFLGKSVEKIQIQEVVDEINIEPEIIKPGEDVQVQVPILIYHHIRQFREGDSENAQQFIVPPEDFERQMKYLYDNGFTSMTVVQLANYFDGTFVLPEKPIIITFDDGVINQYENALPVLYKYNMTATFYIFPNPISKSVNYMTWEQLAEIDQAGMEIGNHGWYHLYWDRISAEELDRELNLSKQTLEENLGHEIFSLAYPFGSYNDDVTQAVKDSGHQTARDIVNGTSHTREDLYNLRGYFVTSNFSRFVNIVSP